MSHNARRLLTTCRSGTCAHKQLSPSKTPAFIHQQLHKRFHQSVSLPFYYRVAWILYSVAFKSIRTEKYCHQCMTDHFKWHIISAWLTGSIISCIQSWLLQCHWITSYIGQIRAHRTVFWDTYPVYSICTLFNSSYWGIISIHVELRFWPLGKVVTRF